jgi:hypothetical protein
MTTPKSNVIPVLWGLKRKALGDGTTSLTLEETGTLFSNANATGTIDIVLPSITTLAADNFIQPFYFYSDVSKKMEIKVTGSDRIVVTDANGYITNEFELISNVEITPPGTYQVGSLIGLIPAEAGKWVIMHITGIWKCADGIIDALGFQRVPGIELMKQAATNQSITPAASLSWVDVVWFDQVYNSYFTYSTAPNPEIVTPQKNGIADVFVSLRVFMPTDGVANGMFIRLMQGAVEVRRNDKPENAYPATGEPQTFYLIAKKVPIVAGDNYKVQVAYNALAGGAATIYSHVDTRFLIKYRRGNNIS